MSSPAPFPAAAKPQAAVPAKDCPVVVVARADFPVAAVAREGRAVVAPEDSRAATPAEVAGPVEARADPVDFPEVAPVHAAAREPRNASEQFGTTQKRATAGARFFVNVKCEPARIGTPKPHARFAMQPPSWPSPRSRR